MTAAAHADMALHLLCAVAMGIDYRIEPETEDGEGELIETPQGVYEPLRNDAQAMALVKRFKLSVWYRDDAHAWECEPPEDQVQDAAGNIFNGFSADLNRAIVECVAKTSRSASTDTATQEEHG
jgi:hypothetical protein